MVELASPVISELSNIMVQIDKLPSQELQGFKEASVAKWLLIHNHLALHRMDSILAFGWFQIFMWGSPLADLRNVSGANKVLAFAQRKAPW